MRVVTVVHLVKINKNCLLEIIIEVETIEIYLHYALFGVQHFRFVVTHFHRSVSGILKSIVFPEWFESIVGGFPGAF